MLTAEITAFDAETKRAEEAAAAKKKADEAAVTAAAAGTAATTGSVSGKKRGRATYEAADASASVVAAMTAALGPAAYTTSSYGYSPYVPSRYDPITSTKLPTNFKASPAATVALANLQRMQTASSSWTDAHGQLCWPRGLAHLPKAPADAYAPIAAGGAGTGSSSSSSGGGVGMSMAEQRAETAAAAAPPPRSYARPAMAPAAERQLKAAASVDAAGASAADCAATPVDVAPNPLATGAGSRSAGAAGVGSHAATAASGGGSRSVVLMPMTGWKGVLACTLLLAVWCPMTLVRDPQALVAAYIGFAAFRLGIFATLYHHVLERYPPRVMLLLVNAESLLSGALSFVVEPIRDAVTARGPQVYPTINAAFLGVSGAVAVMALAILWRARGKAVPVHMPE